MSYRRLMLMVLAVAMPRFASAQFTTFIPPHNAATTDSAKVVSAVQGKAKTDSAMNAQLANMKTWVDSAAGVVSPPTTAADTLAAQSNPQSNPQSQSNPLATPADTAMSSRGTRAPATASNLPLLVLSGAGLLVIGTILLAGARPARQRA